MLFFCYFFPSFNSLFSYGNDNNSRFASVCWCVCLCACWRVRVYFHNDVVASSLLRLSFTQFLIIISMFFFSSSLRQRVPIGLCERRTRKSYTKKMFVWKIQLARLETRTRNRDSRTQYGQRLYVYNGGTRAAASKQSFVHKWNERDTIRRHADEYSSDKYIESKFRVCKTTRTKYYKSLYRICDDGFCCFFFFLFFFSTCRLASL